MGKVRHCLVAAAAVTVAAPASAEWLRAESDHFIIYSKEAKDALTKRSEKLERFDAAVRAVREMDDPVLPAGAKVTLYVLPTLNEVQELAGSSQVYGFYSPRAEGPVAFVPRQTPDRSPWALTADQVLFHEYAHHLMYSSLDGSVPRWLIEGFAEFYSNPSFDDAGNVVLGQSPTSRGWGIHEAMHEPMDVILADKFDKLNGERWESFYGRSWALTHLLTFEPARQGQLSKYLAAMTQGKDGAAAGLESFGDLKLLDKEVTAYASRAKLMSLHVPAARIQVGTIKVESAGPSADKIMPVYWRTRAGVDEKTAAPQAEKVRAAAAAYPDDALAQLALAEAEQDAGNFQAAVAAADRIIATQPTNVDALNAKAHALLALAKKGVDAKANRSAARAAARKANAVAPEDPEPLMLFYQSFEDEPTPPSAVKGLHYALVLAPQDTGLRLTSSRLHLQYGELAEAKRALLPLAHHPHSQSLSKAARKALEAIERKDAKAALAALDEKPEPDAGKD